MIVHLRMTEKKKYRHYQSKTFKVDISFGGKFPLQVIINDLAGQQSENCQQTLRVLDIILK